MELVQSILTGTALSRLRTKLPFLCEWPARSDPSAFSQMRTNSSDPIVPSFFRKAFVVLPVLLAGCVENPTEQTGYFKDDANNRVFQLVALSDATAERIKEHLTTLPHTEGRMTIAFVFETENAPERDLVTLADDFPNANGAILDGGFQWRWWYRQNPKSEITVIDCVEEPGNTICP